MTCWKLGSKWGKGAPNFYSYLKANSFVIGVNNRPYQIGDLVLITDGGFTGLAIAKVSGNRVSVMNQPELEDDFDRLEIDYDTYLYTAPAIIYELKKDDRIWYKAQVGICQINQQHIIENMVSLYSNFEKMQAITDVANLLIAKGQVILQGPPGTGKTWLAERIAEKLADEDDVKLVQFHPAYAYEDFVRGIVAQTNAEGHLSYGSEDKLLAAFAAQAAQAPERLFVLIIDEINRANLPSVLGELIYALEYRGLPVESIYPGQEKDGRGLVLPKNLLVIGTMNTSDRSVGHLDYAIRRRFAFVTVRPEETIIEDEAGRQLFRAVSALFENVFLSPEFERDQVQPGHSYFMTNAAEGLTLTQKLEYEIKPLLQEYLRDGVLRPSAKNAVAALRA